LNTLVAVVALEEATMDFDLAQFALGLAGALVTLYAAKGEIVPEFRVLYDTSESEQRRDGVKRTIAATQAYVDVAQERLTQGGLSDRDIAALRAGLESSMEELRISQDQLKRCDHDIRFGQLLSRTLGFLFYVGLGGVFGWVLADEIDIDGLSGRLESLVLGATWTTYVSSAGFRVLEGRVSKRVDEALEQAASKIEAAKTTLTETVTPKVEAAERAEAATVPVITPQVTAAMEQALDSTLRSLSTDFNETRKQAIRDCKAAM
jgi:hypothetical protein